MTRVPFHVGWKTLNPELGENNPMLRYTEGLPPYASNREIRKALEERLLKPVVEGLYVEGFDDISILHPVDRIRGYNLRKGNVKIGVHIKLATDVEPLYAPHIRDGGNLNNQFHLVKVNVKKGKRKRSTHIVQADASKVMETINSFLNDVQ